MLEVVEYEDAQSSASTTARQIWDQFYRNHPKSDTEDEADDPADIDDSAEEEAGTEGEQLKSDREEEKEIDDEDREVDQEENEGEEEEKKEVDEEKEGDKAEKDGLEEGNEVRVQDGDHNNDEETGSLNVKGISKNFQIIDSSETEDDLPPKIQSAQIVEETAVDPPKVSSCDIHLFLAVMSLFSFR